MTINWSFDNYLNSLFERTSKNKSLDALKQQISFILDAKNKMEIFGVIRVTTVYCYNPTKLNKHPPYLPIPHYVQ